MRPHQKINHFPGMLSVARKNLLAKNLSRMQRIFPQHYQFYPQTWLLPSQYHQFRSYYQTVQKGKCRTYIVKPQALSQGKGIFLTRSIADVQTGLHYVVQRYVTNPYLIQGLKFDLRIYVLCACSNPLRLFIFQQGLVRFATQPYQRPNNQNISDIYRHLTNYAINKHNQKFIFNTSDKKMDVGHKRSLTSIYKLLKDKGQNVQLLKSKIQSVIIKTMLAGQSQIDHQYNACQPQVLQKNLCFQILGFDIMLTKDLNPLLIQVNHLPSFQTDSPLDYSIKKKLLKDTFVLMNLTVKQKRRVTQNMKEAAVERIYRKKNNSKIQKTINQKNKLFNQIQKNRDDYQRQFCGGYKKIYPADGYQKIQKYALLLTNNDKKQKQKNKKKVIQKDNNNNLQKKQQIFKFNQQIKRSDQRNSRSLLHVPCRQQHSQTHKLIFDKTRKNQQQKTNNLMQDLSFKQVSKRLKFDKKQIFRLIIQKQQNNKQQKQDKQEKVKQFRIRGKCYKKQTGIDIKHLSQIRKQKQLLMHNGAFLVPKMYQIFIDQTEIVKKVSLMKKS